MTHDRLIEVMRELENFTEAAISAVEHEQREAALVAAASVERRAMVLRRWIEKEM